MTARKGRNIGFVFAAFLIAAAIATIVSPFGSSSPDGLESVAEELGFRKIAEENLAVWDRSFAPGYEVGGIRSKWASRGIAGAIGTIFVFFTGTGIALALRKLRQAHRITEDRID
ncbi:MAG: PDGLE domain-containing protein [bacterium]